VNGISYYVKVPWVRSERDLVAWHLTSVESNLTQEAEGAMHIQRNRVQDGSLAAAPTESRETAVDHALKAALITCGIHGDAMDADPAAALEGGRILR
jgi:hypothetical protein